MRNRSLFEEMEYYQNNKKIDEFFKDFNYENIVKVDKEEIVDDTKLSIGKIIIYFIVGALTLIGYVFLVIYLLNHFSAKNRKSHVIYSLRLKNNVKLYRFNLDKYKHKKIIEKLEEVREDKEYANYLKSTDEEEYKNFLALKETKKQEEETKRKQEEETKRKQEEELKRKIEAIKNTKTIKFISSKKFSKKYIYALLIAVIVCILLFAIPIIIYC